MQARLDNVLGLRRTSSRDSISSFAGSINTQKAYKKFCKGLFDIGVTPDMISQKEQEIKDIFKPQGLTASTQIDDSTFGHQTTLVDQSQLPEVGGPSGAETSPTPTVPTENEPKSRSRFRPPIDFLVGPLMLAAAKAGNMKLLISTLEYVRNINFADEFRMTALHKASASGHREIIQLLLSKGASIEARDNVNTTPLHDAARSGHTSIVELLLSEGASIEVMTKKNNTPLHFAAWKGDTSTVELLLIKGASIDVMNENHNTPLHFAAWRGHTSTVELLLINGASIEVMNENHNTPLHLSAWGGDTSTLELLLTKGALIDVMNENNDTPLLLAAWKGHTNAVELLLKKGALTEGMNKLLHLTVKRTPGKLIKNISEPGTLRNIRTGSG